jgi:hypothetical protein
MELLKSVLARSLVIKYNLCTNTKRDLYINAYNVRVPSHILILIHHVPSRILVLAPSAYVIVSDHIPIIPRYRMHGNPPRISMLLGITCTSLHNAKVRCVGNDEYVYDRVRMSVTNEVKS